MRDLISTFVQLDEWLGGFPQQMTGIPLYVCQTGEQHVKFLESGLARPDDGKVVEAHVARAMQDRLAEYLKPRHGMIYWRTRFETSIEPHAVVKYFDENGPDVDPLMNRKCVMDRNWVRIACHCRLYRATIPFHGFEFKVTPTAETAMAAREDGRT